MYVKKETENLLLDGLNQKRLMARQYIYLRNASTIDHPITKMHRRLQFW